jgi:hypothetical protein
MSVFGAERNDEPEEGSEFEPDPSSDDEVHELTPTIERPKSVPPEENAEDTRSVASTDTEVPKLSIKEKAKIRNYYYHELNLVDAFEAAAATDLSHNLLGFAIEKNRHRQVLPRDASHAWTSKSRWVDESDAETSRRCRKWAAWPTHVHEFPKRSADRSAWSFKSTNGLQNKRRKLQNVDISLQDALTALGMDLARQSTSQNAQQTSATADKSSQGTNLQQPRTRSSISLVFSADEENSTELLRPGVTEAVQQFDNMLGAIVAPEQNAENQEDLIDWKDVLQIASVSGWDKAALDRAEKRCLAMFTKRRRGVMDERAASSEDRLHGARKNSNLFRSIREDAQGTYEI